MEVSVESILSILDNISEKDIINETDNKFLVLQTNNSDAEIRAYAAQLLVRSNCDSARKALLKLCGDYDELVRVNACDSLCRYAKNDVYNRLLYCAVNDKSNLVKFYALSSIIDIIPCLKVDKNSLKDVFVRVGNTSHIPVKAVCFKGLIVLGYEKYLYNLKELLSSEDYTNRCAVVNVLGDLLEIGNYEYISDMLRERRRIETSGAVISTIDNVLKR